MKSVGNFVPDKSGRRHQTFKTALTIFIAADDVDHYPRRPRIFRQLDCSDAREPDPRIAQFAFDYDLDLLAQGLSEALAMILCPALLHAFTSGKTDENIRNQVLLEHRESEKFQAMADFVSLALRKPTGR